MIINHNMQSINAHRQMGVNQANAQKSMEKLSSGLRINRAGDDAAGLAISEKMRGQIRGLDQAGRNAQDGISMIQTAEGALQETHSILQRMRELSVQSSNDTNTVDDRAEIQKEIEALKEEINRIGNDTEFNTQKLLNGDKAVASVKTVTQGAVATGGTTGTPGVYEIDLNGGTNDITIDGQTFTHDGTPSQPGKWNDATELKGLVDADPTLSAKYDVVVSGTKIQLTQKAGQESATKPVVSGGTYSVAETTAGVAGTPGTGAVAGEYTFKLGNGDITIDGVTVDKANLTGTDAEIQTAINAALNDGVSAADGKYTIAVANGEVTLTQTAGNESATEPVVTGMKDNSVAFQVGANANQNISINISDMRSNSDTLTATTLKDANGAIITNADGTNKKMSVSDIDVTTKEGSQLATQILDNAIKNVSAERSNLGAVQNRLEHTINNLGTSSENLTAAESRIRDVDMAKEMMTMSKNNILNQAAQAMLAQANQAPQQVLQLLR